MKIEIVVHAVTIKQTRMACGGGCGLMRYLFMRPQVPGVAPHCRHLCYNWTRLPLCPNVHKKHNKRSVIVSFTPHPFQVKF